MHRRDCQRYLAGPVAKEPADPGGASPAHLGISDLHLARHGPRPIRCQKPARAESWKRWRVPRRLGHWLCPCPLAHFLRVLHLRSFRVTCPRMRHKRATDERVLGFGRRQLGGLVMLRTDSKDSRTHKLSFRGHSRSPLRLRPDIGHAFTPSRCAPVWLGSPAAFEPLLGLFTSHCTEMAVFTPLTLPLRGDVPSNDSEPLSADPSTGVLVVLFQEAGAVGWQR